MYGAATESFSSYYANRIVCLRFTYKMLKLNKIEIKDKDFSLSLNDFFVIS